MKKLNKLITFIYDLIAGSVYDTVVIIAGHLAAQLSLVSIVCSYLCC